MWIFKVFLVGQLLTSVVVVEDTVIESRTTCTTMMNTAYSTMHEAYNSNPYGIANHTGTIYRRHEWEFRCTKNP